MGPLLQVSDYTNERTSSFVVFVQKVFYYIVYSSTRPLIVVENTNYHYPTIMSAVIDGHRILVQICIRVPSSRVETLNRCPFFHVKYFPKFVWFLLLFQWMCLNVDYEWRRTQREGPELRTSFRQRNITNVHSSEDTNTLVKKRSLKKSLKRHRVLFRL